MKILTTLGLAVGLAALSACNQSPRENAADNIEANAENTADQVRNGGDQNADAVRNSADADGNSTH